MKIFSQFLRYSLTDCSDVCIHGQIEGLGPDQDQNCNAICFCFDGTTNEEGYRRTYEGLKEKCAAKNDGYQPNGSLCGNMSNWGFATLLHSRNGQQGFLFVYRDDLGPNPNFGAIKMKTDFKRTANEVKKLFDTDADTDDRKKKTWTKLKDAIKNNRPSTVPSARSSTAGSDSESGDVHANESQPPAKTGIVDSSPNSLYPYPDAPAAMSWLASHQHAADAMISHRHEDSTAAAASHYQHPASNQHTLASHYQYPGAPAAMSWLASHQHAADAMISHRHEDSTAAAASHYQYPASNQHTLASHYQYPAAPAAMSWPASHQQALTFHSQPPAAAAAMAAAKSSLPLLAPRLPLSVLSTSCNTAMSRPTTAGRKRSLAETGTGAEAATAMAAATDLDNGQCTQPGSEGRYKTPAVNKKRFANNSEYVGSNDTIKTTDTHREYWEMPNCHDDDLLGALIEAGESQEGSGGLVPASGASSAPSASTHMTEDTRSWANGIFSPPEDASCGSGGSPYTGYRFAM